MEASDTHLPVPRIARARAWVAAARRGNPIAWQLMLWSVIAGAVLLLFRVVPESTDEALFPKAGTCVAGLYELAQLYEGSPTLSEELLERGDPERLQPELLESPMLWCWAINKWRAPIRFANLPVAMGGRIDGTPTALGLPRPWLPVSGKSVPITKEHPELLQDGISHDRALVALAFAEPLQASCYLRGAMPMNPKDALAWLNVRPIDGRIAELTSRHGPISVWVNDDMDVMEVRVGAEGSQVTARLALYATPPGDRVVIVGENFVPQLDPAPEELKLWSTIVEDGLGPEVTWPLEFE